MMLNMLWIVNNFIIDHLKHKQINYTTTPLKQLAIFETFGFDNLKINKAPVNTRERRPKVRAFHVLSAISAKANGTKTAVLNLSPNKKGKMTFFTIFERPVAAKGTLTSCG